MTITLNYIEVVKNRATQKVVNKQVSFPRLTGLGFRKKRNGSIVLDERKSATKPKYIGIIVRRVFKPGDMLCLFLQKGLIFDKRVPPSFRSVQKAEQWIAAHAICYSLD